MKKRINLILISVIILFSGITTITYAVTCHSSGGSSYNFVSVYSSISGSDPYTSTGRGWGHISTDPGWCQPSTWRAWYQTDGGAFEIRVGSNSGYFSIRSGFPMTGDWVNTYAESECHGLLKYNAGADSIAFIDGRCGFKCEVK